MSNSYLYLNPSCHPHTVKNYHLNVDIKEKIEIKKDKHDIKKKDINNEKNYIRTENGSLTYSSSGSARIDFFFMILEDTPKENVLNLLEKSWDESPLDTLKLIANLRDIRNGKGIRLQYMYCLYWLYEHHPDTLYHNLEELIKFGYWKDLLNLLMMICFDGFIGSHFIYDYDLVKCKERQTLKEYTKNWWFRPKMYRELKEYCQKILEYYKDHTSIEKCDRKKLQNYHIQYAKEKFDNDFKYKKFHIMIATLFADQLFKDYNEKNKNKRISLASKWAPSPDCHFDKYTLIASTISTILADKLDSIINDEEKCEITKTFLYRRNYRKILSELRKYNQVTESIIPDWESINYNRVSSKCLMKNRHSFIQHDEDRFTQFIKDKSSKISGSVINPYEIIYKIHNNDENDIDNELLMRMWNSLISKISKKLLFKQAISVCDVSGSMAGLPMITAISLTLITMELTEQPWNKYCITFSENPEIFNLPSELNLMEKINKMKEMNWGYNTNINKVFELIIKIGKDYNLPDEQMPKTLFIFTDMEFDNACDDHTNIEEAKQKFQSAGYSCPIIILWNLRDSRSVPVTKGDNGIVMISGYSPKTLKFILDCDLENINPYTFINHILNNQIYNNLFIFD